MEKSRKIDVELIGTVLTMSALWLIWMLLGVAVLVSPGEIDREDIFLSSLIFFTGGCVFSSIIFVWAESSISKGAK